MRTARWSEAAMGTGMALSLGLCPEPAPQPVQAVPPPGSYAVARQPYAVRVGDLDADGVADVVTASLEDACLTLLSGGQAGRPAWRLDLPTGGTTVAAALGDLDGDGMMDLLGAVRSRPGHLASYRGRAGGRPERAPDTALPGVPNDLDAADLDGDGRAEVVVALREESLALVRSAAGDGPPQVEILPVPGCGGGRSYGPDGVMLGRLDGDAHLDLAVACYGAWSVQVLTGRAGGGFHSARQVAAVPGADVERLRLAVDPASVDSDPALGGLRKVRAADLDADGRMDLAAIGDWGILLLAFGAGRGPVRVVATGVDGSNDLAPGDIDGDGQPEILITSGHEDRAVILRSRSWREAAVTVTYATPAPSTPESLILEDLDADGMSDLVLAGQRDHAVQLLRGDGRGGFAPFSPGAGAAP